jgi:pimeloyl-ACP methyl ester carboxylesterase
MKRSIVLKTAGLVAGVLLIAAGLVATGLVPSPRRGPPQADMVIDAALRADVLERLVADLNGYYVFPEKAKAMEDALRARQQAGAYDAITSAEEFAATLTADIQGVTDDRHLDVGYSAAVIPQVSAEDADAPTPEELERMRSRNYGIETVARLPFNIGYLDLRSFSPPELAGPKLAAAMAVLADTHALVIDLRFNNGGDPATVALLASYLFDERTRLNDIYDRGSDRTEQFWTGAVDGPAYGRSRKVYLLLSGDTFSAAEDFAYALQNLERATLIGASTGGGAHPATARRFNDHFGAIIPTGRSISPITHTDWEGVGVIPDIAIDPDDALTHAQGLILAELLAAEKDPARRAQLEDGIADL